MESEKITSVEEYSNIVIVQTAFAGDLILTIPVAQVLKRINPSSQIDMVVIPRTADILMNHPDINKVIIYDKNGKDAGFRGLLRLSRVLRENRYDLAIVPHRSLRSALLVRFAGVKRRIGFDKSTGKWFFTDIVHYEPYAHEINRNISLLTKLGLNNDDLVYPRLFPSFHDRKKVSHFLTENGIQHTNQLIAVAPGSVWNTKRWLKEGFIELVDKLTAKGLHVILIGGSDDAELCNQIYLSVPSKNVYSAAGKFTFLQSAELISRCKLLVSNDSAPMHIACAVRTPVVAIFGATSPQFGFAPFGEHNVVVETLGLSCRPCSIHGTDKCPIGTFDCMKRITSDHVLNKVLSLLNQQGK
jgi:heptosyltransferase-2